MHIIKNTMDPLIKKDTENDPQPPEENFNLFTCNICYEEYDSSLPEFQKLDVKMLSCGHMFCSECFTEYFRSLVED
jgi:hypothetical protein